MRRAATLRALLVASLLAALAVPALAGRGPRIARLFQPDAKPIPFGRMVRIGGNRLLSRREYMDLRNSVKDLLTRFPPERSFFVGLGRDPTPIIAFLQNLGGEELAVNFPGASGKNWSGNWGNTDPAWSEFEKYFKTFIPREVLEGDRDIVLIDQTNSGASRQGTLSLFSPYFARYLKQIGFKGHLRMAAFSAENQPRNIAKIDTALYPEVARFLYQPYEGVVSEYPRHEVGRNAWSELKQRPAYRRFRAALADRMTTDVDLDRFVVERLGVPGEVEPAPPRWRPRIGLANGDRKLPGLSNRPLLTVTDPKPPQATYWQPNPRTRYDYLGQAEYRSIRTGALRLMRTFKPDDAFYVGIGQSSSPIVAFMENLGDGVGTYLPIDGLAAHYGYSPRPSAVAKERYFALFDAFLPEEVKHGGRDLVLFQKGDNNQELDIVKQLLDEYLARSDSETAVRTAVFSSSPNYNTRNVLKSAGETEQLATRKYELVAPYPRTNPSLRPKPGREVVGGDGRPHPVSSDYAAYRAALGERMKRDETLPGDVARLMP